MFYKVVIGDSRKIPEVQDNSVHLVVTSPPYWGLVVFSKKEEDTHVGELSRIPDQRDFFIEIAKVWKECKRVLVPGGTFVCEFEDYPVGSRYFSYPREILLAGDMCKSIEDAGLYLISRWVWRKFETGTALQKFQYTMYDNLRTSTPRAIANWAYCLVFRKMGERKWELDFTRQDWKIWSDGVWNIPSVAEGSEGLAGGAIFPVELVSRFIKLYTQKGETVYDPFGGTGTTMAAAFKLQRNAVICEVLPKMLPVIKQKVGFGVQTLGGDVKWELVERK